jgi:2-polyprenyl-6-methoxyphenol hydroxylase-like FAD-dependent oxidoreductase
MSFLPAIHVAIVGAGPAGLAFARLLFRETQIAFPGKTVPLSVALFDSDLSPFHPVHRPQGGSLDLHKDSGQLALQEAGLWEAFISKARYDAQGWRVDGKDGEAVLQMNEEAGKDRDKPEIGRAELRQLLADGIEGLPGSTMSWARKVMDLCEEQGRFRLVLEENDAAKEQSELFDVVVGADGTWSRVRNIVSQSHLPGFVLD